MPPAVLPRPARPPSAPPPVAPHPSVYLTPSSVLPTTADTVVFLGDLVERATHWVTRTARGPLNRTLDCEGEGCPHCAAGIPVRLTWYAPALVHQRADTQPDGTALWNRVVYQVAQESAEGFGFRRTEDGGFTRPQLRGRYFTCWRKLVGNSYHLRSSFQGRCFELAEAGFPVEPVLLHMWAPTEGSKAAVFELRKALPVRVTPPVLRQPERPAAAPQFTDEEAKLARELLAEFKANGYRLVRPGEVRGRKAKPDSEEQIERVLSARQSEIKKRIEETDVWLKEREAKKRAAEQAAATASPELLKAADFVLAAQRQKQEQADRAAADQRAAEGDQPGQGRGAVA